MFESIQRDHSLDQSRSGNRSSSLKKVRSPKPASQPFADDTVVNALELSQALRMSRWTLDRLRKDGYEFEFGTRSTPGHLKAWLRENPRKRAVKSTMPDDLAEKLAQLR